MKTAQRKDAKYKMTGIGECTVSDICYLPFDNENLQIMQKSRNPSRGRPFRMAAGHDFWTVGPLNKICLTNGAVISYTEEETGIVRYTIPEKKERQIMSHPLTDMLSSSIEKIRTLVDANTIVGTPITTPDGVTLIPVSKVSFGYAGGGSDFASKNSSENPFGGGGGGGVNITPVAFLVVKEGMVRTLPIYDGAPGPVDRALEMLPELVDKISGMISDRKKKPEEPSEEEESFIPE